MPKRRAIIPLVTAIILGLICFILTMVFTIMSAVNVNDLKKSYSRVYGSSIDTKSLDMLPFAEFCICLLLTILIIAPILSALHLTSALDQKNSITYMKANKLEPLPIPRKKSVAAMIEAFIILVLGFFTSTFSGAMNGWKQYNWSYFIGAMIIVFVYSVLHFVIACITLSIDDHNLFLSTGSYTGTVNTQYNMTPAYTPQVPYSPQYPPQQSSQYPPQQSSQYPTQQYIDPANYAPNAYNKKGNL